MILYTHTHTQDLYRIGGQSGESCNLVKIKEREGLYSKNRPLFICTTKITQGEGVNDNASNILPNNRKSNSTKSILNAVSGITLIALVVTIVVLLILASVSITVVFGDNGILQLAKEAGEKTNEAVKNDISSIGELEDILHETQTGIKVDKVTDAKPAELEIDASNGNLFTINSIEDLVFFAHDVTNGNTYEDKTVKLGLSLDFASTKSYVDANRTDYGKYGYNGNLKTLLTSGEGFLPIGAILGYNDKEHSFNGTFDGNEKYIINLRIHKELSDNKNDLNIGLFANNYGTIKKLGIVNCDISGTLTSEVNSVHSGGISGVNFNEINNCFVSGQISSTGLETAKSRAGGISAVGRVFKDCYNLATVTCKGNSANVVGGICCGTDGENCSIMNCYNKGEIIGIDLIDGNFVGGIVGMARESGTNQMKISNCYNIGNISVSIKNMEGENGIFVRSEFLAWFMVKIQIIVTIIVI